MISAENEEKASRCYQQVAQKHGLKFTRAECVGNLISATATLPDLLDFTGRTFTLVADSVSSVSSVLSLIPNDPKLKAWARREDVEFRVYEVDKNQQTIEWCIGGLPEKRRALNEVREVCNGGPFGRPVISEDGRVAFIADCAEKSQPKGWWRDTKTTGLVDKFKYCASFGEALTKMVRPQLMVWDVNLDEVKTLTTEGYVLANPVFRPRSSQILAVGYHTPSKLNRPGLSVCWNRRAGIFFFENDTARLISEHLPLAIAPIFSPDGQILLCSGVSELSSTHCTYLELWKFNATDYHTASKVDLDDESFPGLFLTLHEDARDVAILSDNRHCVFSSNCKGESALYSIDLCDPTSRPTRLVFPASANLLAVAKDDSLIVTVQSFIQPQQLFRVRLDSSFAVAQMDKLSGCPALPGDYTVESVQSKNCSSWLIKPAGSTEPKPVVVKIHGGPHACATNSFSFEIACLVSLGFNVVLPNYRGSGGFGKTFLEALPGNCGSFDVDDCAEAVREALTTLGPAADPSRVIAYGGSHGGFITGWLLGHNDHQKLFKGGVLWNPAVDLVASNLTSDIPEWSVCEVTGATSLERSVLDTDEHFLVSARKMSPISVASKVRAPALVVLGSADQRVNCMAGLRWAQIVEEQRMNKVDVLWYPEQGHAISGAECQEHVSVSILGWISENI